MSGDLLCEDRIADNSVGIKHGWKDFGLSSG